MITALSGSAPLPADHHDVELTEVSSRTVDDFLNGIDAKPRTPAGKVAAKYAYELLAMPGVQSFSFGTNDSVYVNVETPEFRSLIDSVFVDSIQGVNLVVRQIERFRKEYPTPAPGQPEWWKRGGNMVKAIATLPGVEGHRFAGTSTAFIGVHDVAVKDKLDPLLEDVVGGLRLRWMSR